MTVHDVGGLLLTLATIVCVLVRPFRVPEWVWAIAGAIAALVTMLISPAAAMHAVVHGWNVYLFLAGILLFAEVARQHGVFQSLAGTALRAARGSQVRLFTIFFAVGVVTTALLSNDSTAIVLTIAVVAALAETNVSALPYAYACALVSNATSFVLPIANPTNLLLFEGHIPDLGGWLARFGLSSIASIGLTYIGLLLLFRGSLALPLIVTSQPRALSSAGRAASVMLALSALALLVTNLLGGVIGITAAVAGVVTIIVVTTFDRRTALEAARSGSWGIIPLVAGLFVVVGMLNGASLLHSIHHGLDALVRLPPYQAAVIVTAVVTIASNIFNNLPVAVFVSTILHAHPVSNVISGAALIGVDVGPNLTVTGSLATLLWLVIVRQAKLEITPWSFFKIGVVTSVPALVVAALLVR